MLSVIARSALGALVKQLKGREKEAQEDRRGSWSTTSMIPPSVLEAAGVLGNSLLGAA